MTLTEEQRRQFDEQGFLILKGLLKPEEARRYFRELEALLHAAFGEPYVGQCPHWVPAMERHTPTAAALLADPRVLDVAEALLGRPAIGEGTDGSFYAGETRWHHDAVHPDLFEAVKVTLYAGKVDGQSGALRLVPGSHRHPLHERVAREASERPFDANAFPAVVFDAEPGDAVLFDVRVWHGAFNGSLRLAGSLNYRIDPRTEHEVAASKRYFAHSHRHLRLRYGAEVPLYPEYWRTLSPTHQRWAARLRELGVLDAPAPVSVKEVSA